MPADLGWRLGAGFKRLCLQTIKNHINLNCQRRNGFQKLLTASTAPPQPVQGRPRGKHKATNPQTVELAGKQILLLLLQACAGVIANQNLPWLQTRSLSANAMVETGGNHQGGGVRTTVHPRQAELLQTGLPAIRAFEPLCGLHFSHQRI